MAERIDDYALLGDLQTSALVGRNGSVEVGGIAYAAELQRTTAATEAMYLMMRHPFDDLGYRRYEWKCDSLNAPSRRAAERLGFTYEGTFRNGKRDGYGQVIGPDERVHASRWDNGKLVESTP